MAGHDVGLGALVAPLAAGAIILGALAIGFFGTARRTRRWRELGEALGWTPVGPPPRWAWLDGRPWRGAAGAREALLRSYTTGQGRRRETWTALEIALRASPRFALHVRREGLGAKLAKALGGQDVEVGNPDFDGRYRLRSTAPDAARRVLDAGNQLALPGLEPFHEMCVEADFARMGMLVAGSIPGAATSGAPHDLAILRLVWTGTMTEPDRVRAALPALERLAEAVEAAAPR